MLINFRRWFCTSTLGLILFQSLPLKGKQLQKTPIKSVRSVGKRYLWDYDFWIVHNTSVQHLRTLSPTSSDFWILYRRSDTMQDRVRQLWKQTWKTESNSDLQERFDIGKAEGVGHGLQNVLSITVASCCLGCQHRLHQKLKIQDSRLLYYLIREIKMWLNINHITVHNNTYFIF